MKGKLIIFGLILTLVALPLVACAQEAPAPAPAPAAPQQPAPAPAPKPAPAPEKPKVSKLLMASTSMTSGYFPVGVAAADVINKYVPDVELTVVESHAGYGNVQKIKQGDTDIADEVTITVLTESYYGIGKGAEYHTSDLRALFPEAAFAYIDGVREDSGITSYAGLEGETFYFGQPASSGEYYAMTTLETLGVAAEQMRGSYADAVAAVKDKRAVGLHKASALTALDSMFLDINALTPVRLLSLTEEEGKTVRSNIPGSVMFRIPPDTFKALPGHPEIIALGGLVTMCALSTHISQELGYKLVKGWAEHWDEVIAIHPGTVLEPIKEGPSFFIVDGKALVPLHAGYVQYLKEAGVDVPEALIPPEFKG